MDGYTIKRVGIREMATKGDKTYFTRRIGATEWEPFESPGQSSNSKTFILGLVRQSQPDESGHHWSLYVAEEGQDGTVYQVQGDHTYMVHLHKANTNILASTSFYDIHQLAELDETKVERVTYWANHEPPPRAATQAEVRDTCQSWTLKVVRRLIAEGIVEPIWDQRLYDLINSPVLLNLRQHQE